MRHPLMEQKSAVTWARIQASTPRSGILCRREGSVSAPSSCRSRHSQRCPTRLRQKAGWRQWAWRRGKLKRFNRIILRVRWDKARSCVILRKTWQDVQNILKGMARVGKSHLLVPITIVNTNMIVGRGLYKTRMRRFEKMYDRICLILKQEW